MRKINRKRKRVETETKVTDIQTHRGGEEAERRDTGRKPQEARGTEGEP